MSEQKLSMNYVLEQIEKIMADTEYLHSTIAALEGMGPAAGPGDITGQAKAEALATVVKCRETTNQKMLAMYEKMYDDLKPEKPMDMMNDKQLQALAVVESIISSVGVGMDEGVAVQINEILDTIRHM